MKKLAFAVITSALIIPAASTQVRAKDCVKKDGTSNAPATAVRSSAPSTDNDSTKGKVCSYNGKPPTRGTHPSSSADPSAQQKAEDLQIDLFLLGRLERPVRPPN